MGSRTLWAWWRYLRKEVLHRKLMRPLLRVERPPEYGARGVLFGVAIALLPALGVQMLIALGWWYLVRRLIPRWDFHLVVALAWTWTTNVVTFPPLMYLYVMTGRLMLGRWTHLNDFKTFAADLGPVTVDGDWLAQATVWIGLFTDRFALPVLVGMLPWIVVLSWLSYYLTLRWLQARQRRRARRLAKAELLGLK